MRPKNVCAFGFSDMGCTLEEPPKLDGNVKQITAYSSRDSFKHHIKPAYARKFGSIHQQAPNGPIIGLNTFVLTLVFLNQITVEGLSIFLKIVKSA